MSGLVQGLTFKTVDRLLKLRKERNAVEVGFQDETHNGIRSVAEIALYNEFGLNNGPARPFMRTAFKRHANHITMIRILGRRIVAGKLSMEEALDMLGAEAVESVQESIINFSNPANAASTIAQKGQDNPLIDTGLMLNSVTHRKTRNA